MRSTLGMYGRETPEGPAAEEEGGSKMRRGRPRKLSSTTTLKQLGITRDQSSKWQQMAVLPEAEFEALLAQGAREGRILTTAEVVRAARQRRGLQMKPADDPGYCRVIVRIREKTHRGAMALLSATGQDNLSALVDDLLAQWLASHEDKRSAGTSKKYGR